MQPELMQINNKQSKSDMGNNNPSHAEHFVLRSDLPESRRGRVLSAFLDYAQFPLGGVIGVSSSGKVGS